MVKTFDSFVILYILLNPPCSFMIYIRIPKQKFTRRSIHLIVCLVVYMLLLSFLFKLCRLLFVFGFLSIVLSIFIFLDSAYPFGIFNICWIMDQKKNKLPYRQNSSTIQLEYQYSMVGSTILLTITV
jgi:hypothetical protein